MENFIKKIFDKKEGEEIHDEFIKFSRGIFRDRYLIDAKRQKDKWVIKTSSEFANYLVRMCFEKLKNRGQTDRLTIKGAIISTLNLKDEIDFPIEATKQFAGVKQIIINSEIEPEKILSLINKYPRAFFALTFKTEDNELKIKARAPKSAKPGTKGEKKASADFCILKTKDYNIIKDLFFDFPDFKKISVNHTIEIIKIILPKDTINPKEIREKAVRKGRIIRKVIINDLEQDEKEAEFKA